MTIFCFVCKRHVHLDTADREKAVTLFRASGHDDRKVAALCRGLVGVPANHQDDTEVPAEVVECFENHERIAA